MKFSQAMREGAKKGPQTFGILRDGQGGTCAMGAVGLGLGVPIDSSNTFYPVLCLLYPFLKTPSVCPVCHERWGIKEEGTVIATIVHLNNEHRWTREQIADWVEKTYETERIPAQEIFAYCGMGGSHV